MVEHLSELDAKTSTLATLPAMQTFCPSGDAPIHVSLVAVLVIAVLVGWDRRCRERHHVPAH